MAKGNVPDFPSLEAARDFIKKEELARIKNERVNIEIDDVDFQTPGEPADEADLTINGEPYHIEEGTIYIQKIVRTPNGDNDA